MELRDLTKLQSEIDALDSALLSAVAHTQPDALTDGERICIHGYVVLAHGSIEGFLERCFLDYATVALSVDEAGQVNPGLYQVAVALADEIRGQRTVSPRHLMPRLLGLIETKVIELNHGIRASNLKHLAMGVGLDWPDLESNCSDLIGALNSLASARGAPAHMGSWAPDVGIHEEIYPDNARDLTSSIQAHLPSLISYLGESPVANLGRRRTPGRLGGWPGTEVKRWIQWISEIPILGGR